MDDSVDSINVEKIEKDIFIEIRKFILKEFDVDVNGNIKRTAKNLRKSQRIRLLRSIIVSDEYEEKVGLFISNFDTVRDLSDEYIREL